MGPFILGCGIVLLGTTLFKPQLYTKWSPQMQTSGFVVSLKVTDPAAPSPTPSTPAFPTPELESPIIAKPYSPKASKDYH